MNYKMIKLEEILFFNNKADEKKIMRWKIKGESYFH